jgi:thioredoxin-related protein
MTMTNKEKITVLVAEGCPACAEVKKQFGNNKKYELLDVTTNDKALALARKLGVKGVPTFLHNDKKSGKICVLDDKGKVEKCVKDNHQHTKK